MNQYTIQSVIISCGIALALAFLLSWNKHDGEIKEIKQRLITLEAKEAVLESILKEKASRE